MWGLNKILRCTIHFYYYFAFTSQLYYQHLTFINRNAIALTTFILSSSKHSAIKNDRKSPFLPTCKKIKKGLKQIMFTPFLYTIIYMCLIVRLAGEKLIEAKFSGQVPVAATAQPIPHQVIQTKALLRVGTKSHQKQFG